MHLPRHRLAPRRLVVLNAMGGSGKTTVATNLAAWFASRGEPTALMDFDSPRDRMSRIIVQIPPPLRPFADGAAELPIKAGTVGEALAHLGADRPALLARVLTPAGELRPYVNVFVGERNACRLARRPGRTAGQLENHRVSVMLSTPF